jgi:6-pyruvoyl tetrahydropterin synthase-like protein
MSIKPVFLREQLAPQKGAPMQTYCVRKCIAIYHGNRCDRQAAHCHTVEIASYIQKAEGQCEPFSTAEQSVITYLNRYEKQFLNELPEFHQSADIENIGEVFFAGLTELLGKQGMTLQRLEIGETPLRVYAIYCHAD